MAAVVARVRDVVWMVRVLVRAGMVPLVRPDRYLRMIAVVRRGVTATTGIALAAARRDIDVHFHTPSEVKAAVTGNGRAGKSQVTEMVTRILALQQKPTPADAADALALAICHCWRAPMIARMAAAEAMAAEQRRKYQARLKAVRT